MATFVTPTSPLLSPATRTLALACRPVADAWAEVRQAEEGQLYGTLAAALVQRIAARGRMILRRGVRVAAPPRPVDSTAELADAWFALDAMKPRGNITAQLMTEWRSALARRAAKCRESESATIRSASLLPGAGGTHGDPRPADDVDLDACLDGGTKAQARALAGLRWLFKSAGSPWSAAITEAMEVRPRREPQHAPVAEPPMWQQLESAIAAAADRQDRRWRGASAPCRVGCRSRPCISAAPRASNEATATASTGALPATSLTASIGVSSS